MYCELKNYFSKFFFEYQRKLNLLSLYIIAPRKNYSAQLFSFHNTKFFGFLKLNECHHFKILFTKHEKEVINFFSHELKSYFAIEQMIS